MAGPSQYGVEFSGDLFGRLEPRLATVECGNITEFAAIRTATRELEAAEEVTVEPDEIVGRQRKLRQSSKGNACR